jgi:hypothetical protein
MPANDYFLAPSLVGFRASINAAFPKRDEESDGWIGDPAHAARVSEHNPCWTCTGDQYGIVRATDTDIDDNDAGRDLRKEILNSVIWHPAVWYAISNGIIYSRTHGFNALKYTGPNAHTKHVHVSILKTRAAAYDKTLVLRPFVGVKPPPATPSVPTPPKDLPPKDLTITSECIRRLANRHEGVSGACLVDNYQVMNIAVFLNPKMALTTRPYLWKMVAEGDWAEAGKMMNYAVRVIQSHARLPQDGVFGAKTGAFLASRGYKIQ